MAKKKLSDVNAVAQISDNDFITCIMSNGEVGKIKKIDLFPLATEIAAGLMSNTDKQKLERYQKIINTNNVPLFRFTFPSQSSLNGIHELCIIAYNKDTSDSWSKTKLVVTLSGGFYSLPSAINTTYTCTYPGHHLIESVLLVRGGDDGSRPDLYVRYKSVPTHLHVTTSSGDFNMTPTDVVISGGRVVDTVRIELGKTIINAV